MSSVIMRNRLYLLFVFLILNLMEIWSTIKYEINKIYESHATHNIFTIGNIFLK